MNTLSKVIAFCFIAGCAEFPTVENAFPNGLSPHSTPSFEEDNAFDVAPSTIPDDQAILRRIARLKARADALRRFNTNFGGRAQSAFQR